MAATVFQTKNLGINALKTPFWNPVTTITAIQTKQAAVYGEITSFVYKIIP